MKQFKYIVYSLITLIMSSCSEEEFKTFNGEVAGIYLQRTASYTIDANGNPLTYKYTDSLSVSFATSEPTVQKQTTYLDVCVMGNCVSYDRPFVLKLDEAKSTAQRGVHFDFNESDCVIKANTAKTRVPVTIYRHPDLKTGTYRMEFYLESNEYFTTVLDEYKNSSDWQVTGDTLCGTRFKISCSEIYTCPDYWVSFAEYSLGVWSVSKEVLVNELMGWTHTSWINGGGSAENAVQYGHMAYAAKLLRKYLQEAADEGNPVIDDDGSYMQLGEDYAVDYSAYE